MTKFYIPGSIQHTITKLNKVLKGLMTMSQTTSFEKQQFKIHIDHRHELFILYTNGKVSQY